MVGSDRLNVPATDNSAIGFLALALWGPLTLCLACGTILPDTASLPHQHCKTDVDESAVRHGTADRLEPGGMLDTEEGDSISQPSASSSGHHFITGEIRLSSLQQPFGVQPKEGVSGKLGAKGGGHCAQSLAPLALVQCVPFPQLLIVRIELDGLLQQRDGVLVPTEYKRAGI
eukprot:CAMPEP_0174385694 /NCGR_PEP_ID=MMETSP0811_2-20130205/126776_1 /TAXON_ID=73025 ORGANISM="Eutreptiella gymnastica-like, Strain CCMP1594" /NCGR_SAMPLE_ID=MMETSP0811_2 /ASSEMBLY_ACC=CAM_ASM_000667 /LENGTH=172 /DNA_ID=CAMNT_0015540109 /DNA_START=709 /DNA_END=1229 /DNA_ORIENTATION=+